MFPVGFKCAAVAAGIKKSPNALDLALIASNVPCRVAAVFTQNSFAAAPVLVSRRILNGTTLSNSDIRDANTNTNSNKNKEGLGGIMGLIVNAGCANACTGAQGIKDAKRMISLVDSTFFNATTDETTANSLVMSTGVIGQPLPMQNIQQGIQQLKEKGLLDTPESWHECAQAWMTTDTHPKLITRLCTLPSSAHTYHLAGLCKGAGMIHPNMATMLAGVFTDLDIHQTALERAFRRAMDRSFNCISVDGDTSTNDTAVIFANGQAKNSPPVQSDDESPDYQAFETELTLFCQDLAKLIPRDGEGATKFLTVKVTSAPSHAAAKRVAETICTSPLVKTAMFGQDANWGRVLAAVGRAGVDVDPTRVSLYLIQGDISDAAHPLSSLLPLDDDASSSTSPGVLLETDARVLHLIQNGEPYMIDEEVGAEILKGHDVSVWVDLNDLEGGSETGGVTMWTCDFSHDYVSINADYRS